jgi:very-short-patch-repair endonuclease
MADSINRLIELLDYIEQVEKLKRKPSYAVPTVPFSAFQSDLKGLPGLLFNLQSEGDDVWLRITRQKEISAPEPNTKLFPWLTLSKSPDIAPELKTELIIQNDEGEELTREILEDRPDIQLEFESYLSDLWEPWALSERPRRKAISFYNKLFIVQQAISTDGSETPLELVWGLGCAIWKKENNEAINYPLITQACEASLNSMTFDLEIRPRVVDPRIELDCYADQEIVGVRPFEDFWKSVTLSAADRVNPFEPSTYEGVLKAAVSFLDENGHYLADQIEPTLPVPTEKLCVTDTWVVFARKRSGHIYVQDIQNLKQKLINTDSVPAVIASFVEDGSETIRVREPVHFRGLSSSSSGAGVRELFFPMAYNEEQVSIVEKLETNDGVVVQGPPGTGKTHTIANVICHFLAQGKRVLVTAKGESALAVLQEKLPEQIRPLSVSLLTDERNGMRQFEHAIQTIATSVSALNPTQSMNLITGLEEHLDSLHSKMASKDQAIKATAEKHMKRYPFQGKDVTPEDLAKFVLTNSESYSWLDDDISVKLNDLKFTDSDISSLRKSRIAVGSDLSYLNCNIPLVDDFPVWASILAVHKDLVKTKIIEARIGHGDLLSLVDSTHETYVKAGEFAEFLTQRTEIIQEVGNGAFDWTKRLEARLRNTDEQDTANQVLFSLLEDITTIEVKRKGLLGHAVLFSVDAELNQEFTVAVERLAIGKNAFILPFGQQKARSLLAVVTVRGLKPTGKDDWLQVTHRIQYLLDVRKLIARWNSLADEFDLPIRQGEPEESFKHLVKWQAHIIKVRTLAIVFEANIHTNTESVFGREMASRLKTEGEQLIANMQMSLTQHLDKGRLFYARHQVSDLLTKLDGKSGQVVSDLRSFLNTALGNTEITEAELQENWHFLMGELKRLAGLQPEYREIGRVTSLIEASGAIRWTQRLRTIVVGLHGDAFTPPDWLEAWIWRDAQIFLESIDGHKTLKGLFDDRRALEGDLSKTYKELVAEKTWLGVFNNSPDEIRQALQAYLNAVQAMGSGNGIRAIRFRRNAKNAMIRAYKAVPCWILSQWRVSETLPAEIGLFDLVVIDEASQSDIWALPALMRGKKLLVVGDHKQVSPSAVGIREVRIQELIDRFLKKQPHGAEMTPDKSIYDLARVVFAGNSVMLKEHFRCVPAIIEFSNREFYQGDIKPLRIPKSAERLDPPLIDVFVKGGHRKDDVNPPEAKAIIDEIKTIIANPDLNNRSIGVVTLLGTQQAAHINKLINESISQTDIVERSITVGPPTIFQGRERDIMLISNVLAKGNRAAASRLEMEQRFNVALSRARDRMYLFRSVDESDFSPDSLTAKLFRHFRYPFNQDVLQVRALRDLCESDFERDMFDLLTKKDFRVQPQVKCGGYRIDFVVEGAEGRRLAIECDGDRFHGPGQWMDDMARQAVLERAGWTFWRCFASSFILNRNQVASDLFATLTKMGIEPLGAESVDNTRWYEFKEVDPYGTD